MEKLIVYLGDLTHDTIGLATEVFPLNIGFVASYAHKQFPQQLELRLFKSITRLHEAIMHSPPDVLALSNYPWCHNIDLASFEIMRRRRPESIRVMGGPNFPHRTDLQQEYLLKRPLIDTHIYLDGEVPFANLISVILACESLGTARETIKKSRIAGCVHLDMSQKLGFEADAVRIADLDEIPSPYLDGFMDEFFDGRLSPMIQTNRGCPFACTYCADGTSQVNKVHKFGVDRVKQDISYIAQRVKPSTKTLFISDLNYGMYARDKQVSEHIASVRKEFNYPLYIDVSIGKNSKHRIIENIETLNGAMRLGLSVQSMDKQVLEFVKRDNLRLSDYTDLMPSIIKSGLSTASEVILGLPGDSRETHIDSLCQLIDLGVDNVFAYTLMLLNGSELYTPEQMLKWGYQTKFRVIPRDFTWVEPLGKGIVEVEEVVVGSNTLTFEDYVYCRQFVLLVNLVTQDGYKAVNKWLREQGIGSREVLVEAMNALVDGARSGNGPGNLPKLKQYFAGYEDFTKHELWDDLDAINEFFAKEENFQGLTIGKYGINCLQTFRAKIWANAFEELTELYFGAIEKIAARKNLSAWSEQFGCLKKYCQGKTFDILSPNRLTNSVKVVLEYDVDAWMGSPVGVSLDQFKYPAPESFFFSLTKTQYETLESALVQFGRDELSLGKVLIRISVNTLYRKCQLATAGQHIEGFDPMRPFEQIGLAKSIRI